VMVRSHEAWKGLGIGVDEMPLPGTATHDI